MGKYPEPIIAIRILSSYYTRLDFFIFVSSHLFQCLIVSAPNMQYKWEFSRLNVKHYSK